VSDPYDLTRFVRAQEQSYQQALSELERGRKQSHWMWYVFPQFDGLGTSAMSMRYSIKSSATFDQWYNTTDGVNKELPGMIPLVDTPPGSGISVYDSSAFFPIDGQGFGNTVGQTHNYHFTIEIHVKFQYEAGQKFTFRGDDDLWIFVNGKLALDVGGQHQALKGEIDFDAKAVALDIVAGGSYPMDIFHAERQTTASNFRIETNIKCFTRVVK